MRKPEQHLLKTKLSTETENGRFCAKMLETQLQQRMTQNVCFPLLMFLLKLIKDSVFYVLHCPPDMHTKLVKLPSIW